MDNLENPSSPHWNTTAKTVVGLALAGIALLLVVRFQNIIAPLLTSFLLAYLLHPLASLLHKKLKIPWRLIVTIIYLLLFTIIIGLLAWGGVSLIEQVQNLITLIQGLIADLPAFFERISSNPIMIGPFEIDLGRLDLNSLWTQLVGVIQPLLTQLGGMIGSLATGIGSTFTWLVFILLISYFILAEGTRTKVGMLHLPRYQEDIKWMGSQLGHIWNAFLRGQLLIFAITVIYYTILLGVLGVRYFFLLALLAGLARFVPYVGPFVAWTTYGLVALFQVNYFGMQPLPYALLVVGLAWFSDFLLDNFVVPRVMSDALAVHPAAVLVMVIVAAGLFGFLGILLAAPVLASLQLILTYIIRKLTDQDPWTGLKVIKAPPPFSETIKNVWISIKSRARSIASFFETKFLRIKKRISKQPNEIKGDKND